MEFEKACHLLAKIESGNDVNSISVGGFAAWPLVRQCLWFELIRNESLSGPVAKGSNWSSQVVGRVRQLLRSCANFVGTLLTPAVTDATTLFVSRPVYLQALPSGLLFDRILDPLVFLCRGHESIRKYYLSRPPKEAQLHFDGEYLRVGPISKRSESRFPFQLVAHLVDQAGLDPEIVRSRLETSWQQFLSWHKTGKQLFSRHPALTRIFLTSWYFPDMMGLIAAAKESGVTTIDVQHGKQGKFQGMYAWWTAVPESGYQLMPDRFWCWGQPSCDHILAADPGRKAGRPFVGGFPWLDFYRRHVASPALLGSASGRDSGSSKRVLVTLQGRAGAHAEPLPEFIVDFLGATVDKDIHLTFRCHPNDVGGPQYVRDRLRDISPQRYSLSNPGSNLYDELLAATHHVTAFSSCCYEADALGVPTLLFGADARTIYKDDIESGLFNWTSGSVDEMNQWLKTTTESSGDAALAQDRQYIVSSLEFARSRLSQSFDGPIDPAGYKTDDDQFAERSSDQGRPA